MSGGAKTWYFPDGYAPERSPDSKLEAHEAIMLLNSGSQPAHVKLDFYFDNRDPFKDVPITVGAERVVCVRLDKPEQLAGLKIPPMTQYAIRVRSDVKIIAQYGKTDTTQANLAYCSLIGHAEDQ